MDYIYTINNPFENLNVVDKSTEAGLNIIRKFLGKIQKTVVKALNLRVRQVVFLHPRVVISEKIANGKGSKQLKMVEDIRMDLVHEAVGARAQF